MARLSALAAFSGLLAICLALPRDKRATPEGYKPTTIGNGTQWASVRSFANIPITKEINWVSCFDGFFCTNLEVPLDYNDTSAGTTNIAFMKLVGGDGSGPNILFNPGGPGGSGVHWMFRGVGVLQQLAGGNYNWIGFDPRSVKDSGPNLTCFPGDPEAQRDYEIAKSLMLSIPLNELWQRNKAYGERCSAVNVETDARYIGTSAVVQDLKHFIELQATANGASATDAKLWYYGVSYGTTIGQTFAAMYPEMVERMILDGNMYGEGYYNGNAAIDSLTDADAAMRSFFLYCTDAGPSACSFARNGTDGHILTAPEELEQRYDGLLRKLEDVPLVISSTSLKYPNAVTRRGLQGFVLNQLETPAVGFPLLGKMLAELDLGVTATWVWFIDRRQGIRLPSPDVPYNLIQCVDVGRRWELGSTTDYLAYFEGLRNISRYGGETAGLELAPLCAGFSIYPPESQNFHGFTKTVTSTPILFVNSLRDPLTPILNAHKMSKLFPGSSVLAVNATGHAHGLQYGESKCAVRHVQEYLTNATLPEPNTVCDDASLLPVGLLPSMQDPRIDRFAGHNVL